jgi:hypothetical protein
LEAKSNGITVFNFVFYLTQIQEYQFQILKLVCKLYLLMLSSKYKAILYLNCLKSNIHMSKLITKLDSYILKAVQLKNQVTKF